MKYMTDMHEQQDSWALKNSVGGPELKGISKMIYSMKTITETTQFGNLEMRQGEGPMMLMPRYPAKLTLSSRVMTSMTFISSASFFEESTMLKSSPSGG